jgi:uncharacterized protein YdhG (YjbR/CyaY superfamily)
LPRAGLAASKGHKEYRTKPKRTQPIDKPAGGREQVDAYLAEVPEPARTTLQKVRATIRSLVPPETSEEISYGIPSFRYKGGLVAYAAFKKHCSFFPMSASLIETMKDSLGEYRTSKGTLQFPLDKPLPATLLKRILKARVADNENRAR